MKYRPFSTVAALGSLLLLSGCATTYQPEGFTGGFTDKQLANNKYLVTFGGNGYTSPERASNLSMMRGAELALMHGYKYFVVFNSNTAMNEDDIYTGYSVMASFKPTSKYLILGTRTPPKQFSTYFDADKYFESMVKKYKFTDIHHEPLRPHTGPFVPDPSVVQFQFEPNVELAAVSPADVQVYDDSSWMSKRAWCLVGTYTYYERPLGTMDDFVQLAKKQVAAKGANALMIIDDPLKVQDKDANFGFEVPKSAGFLAEAVYLPAASLGVEWEPGALKIGEYIVRQFKKGGDQKGGLLLGDKVLEIEGVDVLKHDQVVSLYKSWHVGDPIKLTVVRDGHEKVITQHLVANN